MFHLHGFNHYVTQLGSSCGFDMYINNHEVVKDLFAEQLKTRMAFLFSLDFAAQTSVANLSLIHSAVNNVEQIENLRNADFTVKQNELMGLAQHSSAQSESFYVTLNSAPSSVSQHSLTENETSVNFTLSHWPVTHDESNVLELSMTIDKCTVELPV